MPHRIVITSYNPNLDFGESLVKEMGVELQKGMWVTENDLIDGARMGTAIELIHLACDATVISL